MRRLFMLLVLITSFTVQLSAQTKKEKIIELFKLIKTDQLISSMADNMTAMNKTYLNKLQLPDAKKDSMMNAVIKQTMLEFTSNMMNNYMVDIYDKYFTQSEIQKYIDFYKTPEGQKMIDVMPALQKEMMSTIATKQMPDMQERIKKKMEEIYH